MTTDNLTSRMEKDVATGGLASIIAANGWFCTGSGAVLLVASPLLANWFDLPVWVIAVTGAALLPYGAFLLWGSRRRPFDRRIAVLATAGDLAWVGGAAVLLLVPNTMSLAGKSMLATVSLAVLGFAVLQLRALRS